MPKDYDGWIIRIICPSGGTLEGFSLATSLMNRHQKVEMQVLDNVALMCLPINSIMLMLNLLAFSEEDKDGAVYPN